ncbi:hypothetical protein FKM82_024710 [Ascaphus truei]
MRFNGDSSTPTSRNGLAASQTAEPQKRKQCLKRALIRPRSSSRTIGVGTFVLGHPEIKLFLPLAPRNPLTRLQPGPTINGDEKGLRRP